MVWHHHCPEFSNTSRKVHLVFAIDMNPPLTWAPCIIISSCKGDEECKTKSPGAQVWFADSNVTFMANRQSMVWQARHPSMPGLQEAGMHMWVCLTQKVMSTVYWCLWWWKCSYFDFQLSVLGPTSTLGKDKTEDVINSQSLFWCYSVVNVKIKFLQVYPHLKTENT